MPLAPIPSRVPRRVVILNDPRQIAAMISDMMKKSGLTQAEIGRRMGLKQQTISMYRQGKVRNPSIGWLVRFANALGARIVMEYDETRVR